MNLLAEIGAYLRTAGRLRAERRRCRGLPVRFLNFWDYQDPRALWFYRFMEHRGLLARHPGRRIAFFSVFGSRLAVWLDRSDVKVFFSGENIGRRFRKWQDFGGGDVDLALGFEPVARPGYLRLPLWVLYLVRPDADLASIRRRFAPAPVVDPEPRDRFATLIARYDPDGLRTAMVEAFGRLGRVDCPGRLLHNTDDLVLSFGDDKPRFLRRYRFNLCPENSDTPGYTSEKPFESLASGCVPVYWGSRGDPEPQILDRDALLQWKSGEDNGPLLARVEELERDPRRYAEFAARPRFRPDAAERIWGWLGELESRLDALLRASA